MTIAQELDERYAQYAARSQARHTVLAKTVGNIASKFYAYLGLTITTWNRRDGKVGGSRIRLGVGAPENFEEKAWVSLPTLTDRSINFSLSYTLSSEQTGDAFHIIFQLSLRCTEDGYVVAVKHTDGEIFLSAEDVQSQQFSRLYEKLVDRIKWAANPDSIIIPQPAQ